MLPAGMTAATSCLRASTSVMGRLEIWVSLASETVWLIEANVSSTARRWASLLNVAWFMVGGRDIGIYFWAAPQFLSVLRQNYITSLKIRHVIRVIDLPRLFCIL